MGLLTPSIEQRTQLYFRDGGTFQFRKLPVEDTCLAEKANGNIVKGWAHFYSAQLAFKGYKGIHADAVTLSFDRDFILDPFNRVPVGAVKGTKPKAEESALIKWTAQIAESQRYKVMNKPGSMLLMEKITMFLGGCLVLMVLGYVIMKVAL